MQKLKRNINMGFRVNEDEYEFVKARMQQAGWDNIRQFLLHLAVRGQIVKFEPQELSELSRLLRNISNNVNQIAKRANETRRVYDTDLAEIKESQDKIWAQLDRLLKTIAEFQEVKI